MIGDSETRDALPMPPMPLPIAACPKASCQGSCDPGPRNSKVPASLAIAACRACNWAQLPESSTYLVGMVMGGPLCDREFLGTQGEPLQRNHHDILKANNHSVFAKKGTRNPFALMVQMCHKSVTSPKPSTAKAAERVVWMKSRTLHSTLKFMRKTLHAVAV